MWDEGREGARQRGGCCGQQAWPAAPLSLSWPLSLTCRGLDREATGQLRPLVQFVRVRARVRARRHSLTWRLERGDVAITHNHVVPHARDAFSADPLDPLQRHHLRVWIRLHAGDG